MRLHGWDELMAKANNEHVKARRVEKRHSITIYRGCEPTKGQLEMRDYSTIEADLIVVDESNSFSERVRGDRKYLTVVCSRVNSYRRFANLSSMIPVIKGKRSKHSNMSSDEIKRVIREISRFTETEYSIVEEHRYIDYESLSDKEAKMDFYIEVLEEAVDRSIRLEPDRSMIIILDNPPLEIFDRLWILGESLSKEYPHVMWFETSLSSGTKVLQVHDIVTGAVADHVEEKPDRGSAYEILKRYVRKRDL